MKTGRGKPMLSPRKRSRTAVRADPSQSKSRSAAGTPSVAPLSELAGAQWTFLTNHGHVLVLLSRIPSLVLREVALRVGITERAVQRIIADLEASGFIEREKIGRQNHYRIRADKPLRHPNESHRTIGELLALINGSERQFR
jgi:predicted transcriptional regulator